MATQKQVSPADMPANAENHYDVSKADLPLHCPMPGMSTWDSHPKVFLPMTDGEAKCPYCGAEYTFVGEGGAGH